MAEINYKTVKKTAENNDLPTREGSNHLLVYGHAGRGFMTCPRHNRLSPGVQRAIRKWFAALGITILLVYGVPKLLIYLYAGGMIK